MVRQTTLFSRNLSLQAPLYLFFFENQLPYILIDTHTCVCARIFFFLNLGKVC